MSETVNSTVLQCVVLRNTRLIDFYVLLPSSGSKKHLNSDSSHLKLLLNQHLCFTQMD